MLIHIRPDGEFIRILIVDNSDIKQLDVRLTKPQTRLLRDALNSEELCD